MAGTLYRDVVSCTWTPTGGSALTIQQVSGVSFARAGTRIASSADDMKRQSLVDSTDHTTTVVVYTKNFPKAVGNVGAGAKAPVRGAAGVLVVVIKTADGGSNKTLTLGDGANTFARCMGGSANPKHADLEAAGVITFRGYAPAGAVCPLVVT